MTKFYKIIDFPLFGGENGWLSVLMGNKDVNLLPFDIKKILVMKDMKKGDVRGGHTHHKTRQILLALSGSCVVELDNGKEKISIKLDKFNRGLLLEPYVWHIMKDFTENTVLLVLANLEYDENDYIRNYEDFLKFIK